MAERYIRLQEVVTVSVLRDTVRPELERIKRELDSLRSMKIHVGIMGSAGSDLLMIAHVHEYGATITAKNVKNLTIPLTKEAKEAGSPRAFTDLEWIPGKQPGVSFLARKRKRKAKGKKHREVTSTIEPKDKYDPDDYDWLYMLVHSVNIPERSFIRASFDNGKGDLSEYIKQAVINIIRKGWTAKQAADYVGTMAAEMTRQYMNGGLEPGKSKVTQLTTTQKQPLYDTGRLIGSITYEVEGGGE